MPNVRFKIMPNVKGVNSLFLFVSPVKLQILPMKIGHDQQTIQHKNSM